MISFARARSRARPSRFSPRSHRSLQFTKNAPDAEVDAALGRDVFYMTRRTKRLMHINNLSVTKAQLRRYKALFETGRLAVCGFDGGISNLLTGTAGH